VTVHQRKITFSLSIRHALEHKLLRARQIQQRQIFRRRSHKNQIGILGVVERKQTAPLDPSFLTQRPKHLVQRVDGQHFSYTRIVIANRGLLIVPRIEISHPAFGTPHERRIAENNERWFRA
jgi:hypothetical protein